MTKEDTITEEKDDLIAEDFEIPVIEVDGDVVTRAPVDLRAVLAALDAAGVIEGRR